MRRLTFVLSLLAVALIQTEALADLVFDFESPAYAGSVYLGTALSGQNGWYLDSGAFADGYVATSGSGGLSAPLAGAQSVIVDPTNGSAGVSLPSHSSAGAGFRDGTILSGLIKPNGAAVTILSATVGSNRDGIASMRFNSDGTVHALSSSSETWVTTPLIGAFTVGHVFDAAMTFNFTAQSYTVSVKDLTTPAASFTSGAIGFRNDLGSGRQTITTAMAEAGDIVLGTVGNGGAVFDNIRVGAVPEPGTMALLATGLVGLLAYAWRKRR